MRALILILATTFLSTASFAEPSPIRFFSEPTANPVKVNLQTCKDRFGNPNKLDVEGQLLSECRADTLYTWGSTEKVEWMKTWASGDSWSSEPNILFLARAPIATFGYGDIPIRVKLKKSVRYYAATAKWIASKSRGNLRNFCKYLGDEIHTTVFFSARRNNEWIICSSDVIDSWSIGTKPHYDEMVADYLQHKSGSGFDNFVNDAATDTLFDGTLEGVDGKHFSESLLLEKMARLRNSADENGGAIFFSPSVPVADRNPENHFSTDYTVYFNRE